VELFETPEKEYYFTAQWFYRAEDTVKIEFYLFRVLVLFICLGLLLNW